MCGKHKHGGYCCSQQPWQLAYCYIINKAFPPWQSPSLAPGQVTRQQTQPGAPGNLAWSQSAVASGDEQGHSGLSAGQLGAAPELHAPVVSQGRAGVRGCLESPSAVAVIIAQISC